MSEAYSKEIKTSQDHAWELKNDDDTTISGWVEYRCSECGLIYEYKYKRMTSGGYEFGKFKERFCTYRDYDDQAITVWKKDEEPTCAQVKMEEALE